MRYFYLLFYMAFSVNAFAEETKEVFFGTSTETITIPFGEPTVLKFEKRIKRYSNSSSYIINPEDELNPDYTTLSVVPKFTKGSEKITFILENEKIARIRFKTEFNEEKEFKELTFELRAKSHLDKSKAPPIGEVELLKAMVGDNEVAGFSRKVVSKTLRSGQKGVSKKLVRIYEGRNMNGYVFKLTSHLYRNKSL